MQLPFALRDMSCEWLELRWSPTLVRPGQPHDLAAGHLELEQNIAELWKSCRSHFLQWDWGVSYHLPLARLDQKRF